MIRQSILQMDCRFMSQYDIKNKTAGLTILPCTGEKTYERN